MSQSHIFSRKTGTVPPPPPPMSAALGALFAGSADFAQRPVWPGGQPWEGVTLFWIDGLVSGKNAAEDVLRPLTDALRLPGAEDAARTMERLERGAVWACSVRRRQTAEETAEDLVRGCCAVVFDAAGAALTFEVKSEDTRSVGEPTVEKTVKGAKDAFVETLRTNTALVRRVLRTPRLHLRQSRAGRRSGTEIALMWLDGVANPETVDELSRRIAAIDVDGLTAAGNLEQYLTDRPGSVFPQMLHTERPDTFAAELLAGRVGLIADGLPLGFLLPAALPAFLRVTDDRAQHWLSASLLLLLRWLALLVSMLFPALFVAVATYHQEMIPTSLLRSIIEAKQQVPFSVAFEIFTLLLAFELLLEAGIRLPDPVGDTVSIIGALIVGQAAVEARVVSPISVIVVAATAICGFTQPSRDLSAALRLLRFGMAILAALLGLFGVALGCAALVWYLCGMDSFGVPYASPMAEGGFREIIKAFLRLPLRADKYRERALRTPDARNQK